MLIFLVGFMGSGKTHTGKVLAEQMEYLFVDLDEYIETQEKKTIAKIFEDDGEARFRALESQYLRKMDRFGKFVVATGGGTPCFKDNLNWMKANGLTIYLKASPQLLAQRLLQETSHRPLLAGKSSQDLSVYIEQKLEERAPAYEAADVIIEQDQEVNPAQLIAVRLFGR